MFRVEGTTIHCSRGERGTISLKIPITDTNNNLRYEDSEGKVYWYDEKNKILYDENYQKTSIPLSSLTMVFYQFKEGDKIILNVYEKNGYGKEPLMSKEVIVREEAYDIDIPLMEEDTTFGEPVNKPTTFWYDISLNEYMTIVCYDEDGAKEFIEYPAKGDGE